MIIKKNDNSTCLLSPGMLLSCLEEVMFKNCAQYKHVYSIEYITHNT